MRRWRKSTKLLGLTSFELGEYMIFLTQMEKLTVCKEGTIKFKPVNSSDTVVGFFPSNDEWQNKDFLLLFIKHF